MKDTISDYDLRQRKFLLAVVDKFQNYSNTTTGDVISDYGLRDRKFLITNVDKSTTTTIESDAIHINQEIVQYMADLPLCRVYQGLVNYENYVQ